MPTLRFVVKDDDGSDGLSGKESNEESISGGIEDKMDSSSNSHRSMRTSARSKNKSQMRSISPMRNPKGGKLVASSHMLRDKKVRKLVKSQKKTIQRDQSSGLLSDESEQNDEVFKQRDNVFRFGFGSSEWDDTLGASDNSITPASFENPDSPDAGFTTQVQGEHDVVDSMIPLTMGNLAPPRLEYSISDQIALHPHHEVSGETHLVRSVSLPVADAYGESHKTPIPSQLQRGKTAVAGRMEPGSEASREPSDNGANSSSGGIAWFGFERLSSRSRNTDENRKPSTAFKEKRLLPPERSRNVICLGLGCIGVLVGLVCLLVFILASDPEDSKDQDLLYTRSQPPRPLIPVPGDFNNSSAAQTSKVWTIPEILDLVNIATPGHEYLHESSTQFKALDWLGMDVNDTAIDQEHRILQRYILATLYYATSGTTSWTTNRGWLTSTHECAWFGVKCGSDGSDSYNDADGALESTVTFVNLAANGMEGTLPSELAHLSDLGSIQLQKNSITGEVPPSLFTFPRLHTLLLYGNNLQGPLPSSLNMPRLESLDLSDNSLQGSLPEFAVGDIVDLRLAGNRFTGEIPATYGLLESLATIDFGRNELTSTIPQVLGLLPHLSYVLLHDANLRGAIPQFKSTDLVLLHLDHNEFDSELPVLQGTTSLKELRFDHNELVGEIPSGLQDMLNLELLWLQANALSGTVPSSLGLLTELKELHIFDNSLVGSVPEAICSLKQSELISLVASCPSSGEEDELVCMCCDACSPALAKDE
eukprot:CAMPEP_0194033538 /NCGR_PEP_ID=MMETSP0009_2-20130614/6196_1 /TAXON_ID=210454 /ORGANISM="Grammatophora oceanica, Strain CCMP 410" /LENGTH=762 /DNA_ID=CAMNT_0038674251 /DNA_START=74 /DNA_END=2362 /DNA_ORIENTATION=-